MRILGTEPSSVVLFKPNKSLTRMYKVDIFYSCNINVKYKRTDALSQWHQQ